MSPSQTLTSYIPTKDDFWFLPLGGADEIGMNLNLFGHDGHWIIIDVGVTFHDRLGVEIITPDIKFLLENNIKISAIVVTHAHEDHIGAIPYMWPLLNCPIYATPFTSTIIRQKISEKDWGPRVEIHDIDLCGRFSIGPFEFEYVTLTHSIPEPNALIMTTPLGRIVHTGDWKIDPTPLIGNPSDLKRLEEVGNEGVLALICDSTSVFCDGESGSEADVREELTKLIGQYPDKRITVTCFASNLARIETIALAAQTFGRKVILLGRSLLRMTEAARKNGYLEGIAEFAEEVQANNFPHEKVLFISTGSQGEPRAALARIAAGSHPRVKMNDHDVVIFSSRMIPGNEKSIGVMQNQLVRQNVTVVTATEKNIHVSGHPARNDLRLMYRLTKPKIVIPVHGEARHLQEQGFLAKSEGVEIVITPTNGSLISLDPKNPRILEEVPFGRCFWEGGRLLSVESSIFRDRTRLSQEGVVFITIRLNKQGTLAGHPYVSFCGLVERGENTEKLNKNIVRAISQALNENMRKDDVRRQVIGQSVRRVFAQHYGRKPMTYVHIVSV